HGVDLLTRIVHTTEAALGSWEVEHQAEIETFLVSVSVLVDAKGALESSPTFKPQTDLQEVDAAVCNSEDAGFSPQPPLHTPDVVKPPESSNRALRVTAGNVSRLLGLAGESLVASHWLETFTTQLLRVKRLQQDLARSLNSVGPFLVERETS